MKRVMMGAIIFGLVLLLTGCLDYKINSDTASDTEIIDEIAQIEKEVSPPAEEEVNLAEENKSAEGEVVIPKLEEKENEVQPVNEANIYTLTVKENEMVKVKVNITDPDKDPVTYTFSKPLNPNGEWKTEYGDAGEYIVTLTASDGIHSVDKKIKIVVQRVNMPPVIEPLKDLAVKESDTITFEPKISDPNKDPITVTISEPLKTGKWVTDYKSAGEYSIKVTASDGEKETESSFKLSVKDVNVPPEITNVQDLNVKEGEIARIKPIILDPDEGDTVKVDIGSPVGNSGAWQTGYTDHGDYAVTVTADDGKEKVTKKVNVHVEDVNMPPEITSIYLG